MSLTNREMATEILKAALAAGVVKSTSNSSTGQGDDIGSAFKRIHEAVAKDLLPGP